jgi:hypothetical protein
MSGSLFSLVLPAVYDYLRFETEPGYSDGGGDPWLGVSDNQPLYAVGWPPEAQRPTCPADRQLQDAQQAAIRLIRDGLLEVTKAEPFDHGTSVGQSPY